MRTYITATGIQHTDLQGFSLLDTLEEVPIPGILTSETFIMMNEIVDHPNTYFRAPDFDREAIREMFTIDQTFSGFNDGFLSDVCYLADTYREQNKVVIIVSYKDIQDNRLGVAFVTVPRSEMDAFVRNTIIDELLETL